MSGDGGARILIVDDVPENVRLLEALLASRGYEVVSTTDGDTALELAESAEPDLVLLDVRDAAATCLRRASGLRGPKGSRPVRTTSQQAHVLGDVVHEEDPRSAVVAHRAPPPQCFLTVLISSTMFTGLDT